MKLKALLLTREYPPHIYGGAGVHVQHLAAELARSIQVEVRCFGEQDSGPANPRVRGYAFHDALFSAGGPKHHEAFAAMAAGLRMAADETDADVVHAHTWYVYQGAILARLGHGRPLAVTVHSLEPLRPWKRDALGRGYDVSSWLERQTLEIADAVIAVSEAGRADLLRHFQLSPRRVHVVPNGIDADAWRPSPDPARLREMGVDPQRPYVLFLGRLARQKGIDLFLRAVERLPREVAAVVCAASPDTPELAGEVAAAVERLGRQRPVTWIREFADRRSATALYSGARAFCCPSIYEPFGLINLEAMACETPVVATAVGGIPEVVEHGRTGWLVELHVRPEDGRPSDPEAVAEGLAAAMIRLLEDETAAREMGRRGRQRVVRQFGWDSVGERVLEIYRALADPTRRDRG